MSTFFIVALLSAVACFIIPSVSFTFASESALFNRSRSLKNSVFIPIFTVLIACSVIGYLILYNENDYIHSTDIAQITLPLIGALVIYLVGYINKMSKLIPVVVFLCALGAVLTTGDDNLTFLPQYNVWVNRAVILVAWFAFSLLFRYTNSGDSMLSVQSLTIFGGIGILSMIGALPAFIGFLALINATAFAALLAFSWHPSRIKISNTAATAFGFLTFGMISFATYEGCAPCMLILCGFMIVDIIWAVGYKLTFINKYKNVINNTSYRQALDEGMNPVQAASFSIRIQILLVFFGVFQAYSPNPASLIFLSYLITVWLCFKFRTVPPPPQSLKNINMQVIEELQERVKDIKEIVNRDDES